jgi:hypothetical protein
MRLPLEEEELRRGEGCTMNVYVAEEKPKHV